MRICDRIFEAQSFNPRRLRDNELQHGSVIDAFDYKKQSEGQGAFTVTFSKENVDACTHFKENIKWLVVGSIGYMLCKGREIISYF